MESFKSDLDGYLNWLRKNADGYVLAKHMLHRATCDHVGADWRQGEGDPTRSEKLCSNQRSELTKTHREKTGEQPLNCFTCAP